jgi:hypothetical protein
LLFCPRLYTWSHLAPNFGSTAPPYVGVRRNSRTLFWPIVVPDQNEQLTATRAQSLLPLLEKAAVRCSGPDCCTGQMEQLIAPLADFLVDFSFLKIHVPPCNTFSSQISLPTKDLEKSVKKYTEKTKFYPLFPYNIY